MNLVSRRGFVSTLLSALLLFLLIVAAAQQAAGTMPASVANDDAFHIRQMWAVSGLINDAEPPAQSEVRASSQRTCELVFVSDYLEYVFGARKAASMSDIVRRTDQLIEQPSRLKASSCFARSFTKVTAADVLKALKGSLSKARPPITAQAFLAAPSVYLGRAVVVRGEVQRERGEYRLSDGKSNMPLVLAESREGLRLCDGAFPCVATVYGLVEDEKGRLRIDTSHWER